MMQHRYGLTVHEIMEFEDSAAPVQNVGQCRTLFPFAFDPPYPAPAYAVINDEREEATDPWSRFRLHFRPALRQYPFSIDITDCLDLDSVKVQNFCLYEERAYVLSRDDNVYAMHYDGELLREYDIQEIYGDTADRVRKHGRRVSEREALLTLITYIYPFDCPCLTGVLRLGKHRPLEPRNKDFPGKARAALARCAACGRYWLVYDVPQNLSCTGEALRYYGMISRARARGLPIREVADYLASLGWYYRHSPTGLLKQCGPLPVRRVAGLTFPLQDRDM